MRLALASTAFPAALLSGCGAGQPPITVAQYLQQCDALKGKLVGVAGYVGECSGYECTLFPDASGPAKWHAWVSETLAAVHRERDGLPENRGAIPPAPAMVGIGGAGAFDRKAANFQNRYVVVTALVDQQNCTGAGGTDRSPGLHPTDIRAWTPSEGAPQNSN